MTGMLLGPLPYWIDPDIFWPTLFTLFYETVPVKSGTMRDGLDYESYGDTAYFWDSVIYSNYQDTVTSYAGWFSDELPARYNWLLSNWSEIDSEEGEEYV